MTVNSTGNKMGPWFMLVSRIVLFGLFQLLIAGVLWFQGYSDAWTESARWWPFGIILTNIFCLVALKQLLNREGLDFWNMIQLQRDSIKADIFTVLILLLLLGPIGFFPNLLLGQALFGSSQIALNLYIQPLPLWAIWTSIILFPLSQGLAELPTYFGYVMPRLEKQTGNKYLSIILPALFLSAQHINAPLIIDYRFILWRLLMFLPFAFAIGFILRWKPRLLPYLMVIHFLMDLSLTPFFFLAK
jgi:hypothetical protein